MLLKTQAKILVKQAVDMLLPPRCIVQGEIVGAQGAISASAFAKLDFIASPFCACCGVPFGVETEAGSVCVACLSDRPVYSAARSALVYNDASREMILGFKHGDRAHAVVAFTPWMMRTGKTFLEEADFIVPVPLHRWRLLSRRYNQAALIGAALSKVSNIRHVPDLLLRIKATVSQGHLPAKERAKNVAKAFAVNGRYQSLVRGKVFVLVDDVYTTGSTVNECARVLIKAGAKDVYVLTLARTVKSEYF